MFQLQSFLFLLLLMFLLLFFFFFLSFLFLLFFFILPFFFSSSLFLLLLFFFTFYFSLSFFLLLLFFIFSLFLFLLLFIFSSFLLLFLLLLHFSFFLPLLRVGIGLLILGFMIPSSSPDLIYLPSNFSSNEIRWQNCWQHDTPSIWKKEITPNSCGGHDSEHKGTQNTWVATLGYNRHREKKVLSFLITFFISVLRTPIMLLWICHNCTGLLQVIPMVGVPIRKILQLF